MLAHVHLLDSSDSRSLRLYTKMNGDLSVAALYKLAMGTAAAASFSKFVWENYALSKAKFFDWILVQEKIQSRAMLLRKKMLTPAEAVCPICLAETEDASHMIFRCPLLRRFWDTIDACLDRDNDVRGLHELPHVVPGKGSILVCWNVWKLRNGVAFRGDRPDLRHLVAMCKKDTALWRERLPSNVRAEADLWLSQLNRLGCNLPLLPRLFLRCKTHLAFEPKKIE
jgi:hypothetical protein